jgi:Protein of unknown function with HXXEE motif
MRFVRRHWYSLGLAVGGFSSAWAFVGGLTTVQLILLLNFIVLLLHQFEEYAWPGGEPWIINEVMQPKGDRPDRYPLNQNNAFIINVPLAYSFYLLPVFFPEAVWVGLAPVLFGFGQFVAHGIANNRKLKSLYNPGLAAVVLGHVPLGLWYLREVQVRGIITVWDLVFATVYLAVFIVVGMLKVGYGLLADRNSPYPFAPEEMERFERQQRLARIRGAR